MENRNAFGTRALVALASGGQELAEALRSDGWVVEMADSGWDAAFALWPSLENEPGKEPPQLIVVSAFLRGMSGLSLLAEVRALGWTCPIYVGVPESAHQTRIEALALGADATFDEPEVVSENDRFGDDCESGDYGGWPVWQEPA
jgi:DNA-binding response OmpR family regulator